MINIFLFFWDQMVPFPVINCLEDTKQTYPPSPNSLVFQTHFSSINGMVF